MKVSCAYFVVCTIIYSFHTCTANCESEPAVSKFSGAILSEDGKLNFTQLVIKYGQFVEQYDVVTEDGYILTTFRIPGKKPPVLLFHGLFDSCDTFVTRGNASLVISLATAGYEVWVGNSRGNQYGRRHVTLNADKDKKFWDYSFQEIGYYDLAATIDFIRNKTGVESIATVGHSQGTTVNFVLTSLRPQYNDRIKVFIALAPIVFLDALGFPVSLVADVGPVILKVAEDVGIEGILKDSSTVSELLGLVCNNGSINEAVCNLLATLLSTTMATEGTGPDFIKGVAFGHYPRATSRKSLAHLDQVYLRHSFAQYDYGLGNLAKYGSLSPPKYNLTAVTTKVALFVGKKDKLGTVKDAETLNRSLPNVVHYEVMKPEQWDHIDFVWGKDMPTYLFPTIFELLEKYK